MNTNQIANRLVELCRKGQWETAQKELFAKDAISIEAEATPAFQKETKGLSAILEKGQKWGSMVEKVNKVDEIVIFFFILFTGFLYAHKKGALKWM